MITQSQLNTCRRVADYLRKTAMPFLADIYADRDAETEKNSVGHTKKQMIGEIYTKWLKQSK
jgi:hypothetical protein